MTPDWNSQRVLMIGGRSGIGEATHRRGGSLTFFSGVYSLRPQPDAVLQGALNAAVEARASGLALELAPAVRVNTVSPSTTETPLWDKLGADGRTANLATMRRRLPLHRVADAADIAPAILFVPATASPPAAPCRSTVASHSSDDLKPPGCCS